MKKAISFFLIISGLMLLNSCIEELPIETVSDFESVLVVEGTITNEFKQQEIKLSRSFELDSLGPRPERSAMVSVIGSNGFNMSFNESEPGLYVSNDSFSAEQNVDYHLEITTNNGRQYTSSDVRLTQATPIDDLYAVRDFNENGEEGVSIYVDAFDPTGSSKFYRYTYEETYEIIAPEYSPYELHINNDDFPYPPEVIQGLTESEIIEFFVTREFRPEQEQICYNTVASNSIIIENTNQFVEDRINGFRVRFISRENYIMSHRYSILVNQYIQSPQAHEFYKSLKEISETETIFSTTQPGFLNGNVSSVTNDNEKVVGFFEVATVDSKRIYFNYADLFPGEDLPPYYIRCDAFFTPDLFQADPLTGEIGNSPIQTAIIQGRQYWAENDEGGFFQPYYMVLPECGDCTFLGETEVPDFWED